MNIQQSDRGSLLASRAAGLGAPDGQEELLALNYVVALNYNATVHSGAQVKINNRIKAIDTAKKAVASALEVDEHLAETQRIDKDIFGGAKRKSSEDRSSVDIKKPTSSNRATWHFRLDSDPQFKPKHEPYISGLSNSSGQYVMKNAAKIVESEDLNKNKLLNLQVEVSDCDPEALPSA